MVPPSRYMHPSKAFELLAARCEKLNVPRTFRDELVHRLNYFKTQALCDHDRREDDRKIREHWAELELSCRACGLFEDARQSHTMWPVILEFLGVQDPKYVPEEKYVRPPQPERRVSPYEKWSATDFFRDLKRKVASASEIPRQEKIILKISLNYLFAESLLPRSNRERDTAAVKETWKIIWPTLNKFGLLNDYRKDTQLRSRVEFFMKDGF